jgi:hypothetical protein
VVVATVLDALGLTEYLPTCLAYEMDLGAQRCLLLRAPRTYGHIKFCAAEVLLVGLIAGLTNG